MHDHQAAQRHLQRPLGLVPDAAPQLDDLLHPLHALPKQDKSLVICLRNPTSHPAQDHPVSPEQHMYHALQADVTCWMCVSACDSCVAAGTSQKCTLSDLSLEAAP